MFHNTNFKIKCSEKALDYLFTIVLLFITDKASSYREVTYLRSYYDKFVLEILKFEDDIGSSLNNPHDLNDLFTFNALTRRNEVSLSADYYCVHGHCICFQNNYYRVDEKEESYTSVDFTIGFARSEYKIPYEAIENNCIAISDLENWKI